MEVPSLVVSKSRVTPQDIGDALLTSVLPLDHPQFPTHRPWLHLENRSMLQHVRFFCLSEQSKEERDGIQCEMNDLCRKWPGRCVSLRLQAIDTELSATAVGQQPNASVPLPSLVIPQRIWCRSSEQNLPKRSHSRNYRTESSLSLSKPSDWTPERLEELAAPWNQLNELLHPMCTAIRKPLPRRGSSRKAKRSTMRIPAVDCLCRFPEKGECCVALDCEMVLVQRSVSTKMETIGKSVMSRQQYSQSESSLSFPSRYLALARLTVVRPSDSHVFLDELVKPEDPVIDYLTRFSGITVELLESVQTTRSQILQRLRTIIGRSTWIIGHALGNDLKALGLCPGLCSKGNNAKSHLIDTALLYPHPSVGMCIGGGGLQQSLSVLTRHYLQRSIQSGSHDSLEDAIATAELVKLKLTAGMDWGNSRQIRTELLSSLLRTECFESLPPWTGRAIPKFGALDTLDTLREVMSSDGSMDCIPLGKFNVSSEKESEMLEKSIRNQLERLKSSADRTVQWIGIHSRGEHGADFSQFLKMFMTSTPSRALGIIMLLPETLQEEGFVWLYV